MSQLSCSPVTIADTRASRPTLPITCYACGDTFLMPLLPRRPQGIYWCTSCGARHERLGNQFFDRHMVHLPALDALALAQDTEAAMLENQP